MNEELPYIERPEVTIHRDYNPSYGDDRVCVCGHVYSRHFDSYEEMANVGCKYCGCHNFQELSTETPLPELPLYDLRTDMHQDGHGDPAYSEEQMQAYARLAVAQYIVNHDDRLKAFTESDEALSRFASHTEIVKGGPVCIHGDTDAVGQVIKLVRAGGSGYLEIPPPPVPRCRICNMTNEQLYGREKLRPDSTGYRCGRVDCVDRVPY